MIRAGRKGEAMRPNIGPAKIRLADPDDLEDIRRIARSAYAIYIPRIGREPAPMKADFASLVAADHLWVATSPGAARGIVGFVVGFPRDDHWHLSNVAVDRAAQGNGVGRVLIAHVEAMARAAGAQAVELYTNTKMTENQSLYPRLGYAETGRGTEDGFDRVFYRKGLT